MSSIEDGIYQSGLQVSVEKIEEREIYVVSDIHGSYDELQKGLKQREEKGWKVIYLGDYVDRGRQSKEVVQYIKREVESGRGYALKGNHEDLLLSYIYPSDKYTRDDARWYIQDIGGYETIESFMGRSINGLTHDEVRSYIREEYREEMEFLANLPTIIENEDTVYVHAGLHPYISYERLTEDTCLWIREECQRSYIDTIGERQVMFGHTPYKSIRVVGDTSKGYWESKDKQRIGIDGGCVYGGVLNIVKVRGKEIDGTIQVNKGEK